MGQNPSKEKQLYKHAKNGNIPAIIALRNDGAGLEYIDTEGRTPLTAACHMYNVTEALIQLGADIDANCPGYGTALHHAARRGHHQIVELLLSHGANALKTNDDGHTPLDVARALGLIDVVELIEEHVCLFSGWMREPYGPGFLDYLAPHLLSRKVWVVVLPCGSSKLQKRPNFNLDLAIYSREEDAQARIIIPLSTANFEEPDFSQADPVAIITDISRSNRIKLAAAYGNDKVQLQRFCNACKGIPSTVAASDDDEETHASEASTSRCGSVDKLADPEIANVDGPIAKSSSPAVDVAVASSTSSSSSRQGNEEDDSSSSSSCTICLDAPVEVACVPCGHMAGCMSCMNELRKGNEWACPVCRTNIDRVIRIYAV